MRIADSHSVCEQSLMYTSQTPLGDPLSPSAKQPLELYQMELGSHLPTSQEAPFVPYFYCGGDMKYKVKHT